MGFLMYEIAHRSRAQDITSRSCHAGTRGEAMQSQAATGFVAFVLVFVFSALSFATSVDSPQAPTGTTTGTTTPTIATEGSDLFEGDPTAAGWAGGADSPDPLPTNASDFD